VQDRDRLEMARRLRETGRLARQGRARHRRDDRRRTNEGRLGEGGPTWGQGGRVHCRHLPDRGRLDTAEGEAAATAEPPRAPRSSTRRTAPLRQFRAVR
jgi:hypothetical protein